MSYSVKSIVFLSFLIMLPSCRRANYSEVELIESYAINLPEVLNFPHDWLQDTITLFIKPNGKLFHRSLEIANETDLHDLISRYFKAYGSSARIDLCLDNMGKCNMLRKLTEAIRDADGGTSVGLLALKDEGIYYCIVSLYSPPKDTITHIVSILPNKRVFINNEEKNLDQIAVLPGSKFLVSYDDEVPIDFLFSVLDEILKTDPMSSISIIPTAERM